MSSIIEKLCGSSKQINLTLKNENEINEKNENSHRKMNTDDKHASAKKIVLPHSSSQNNNSKSNQAVNEKPGSNKEKTEILKKNEIVNLPPKKEINDVKKKESKEEKKELHKKTKKPVETNKNNHSSSSKEKIKTPVSFEKPKIFRNDEKPNLKIENPIDSENDLMLNEIKNIKFEDLIQMDKEKRNKYEKFFNQNLQDKKVEDKKEENKVNTESQHLNKKRQRPNNHNEPDSKKERPKDKKQDVSKNELKTDSKLISKELALKKPLNPEKKKVVDPKYKAPEDKLTIRKEEKIKNVPKETENKTFKHPNLPNIIPKIVKTESKSLLDTKEKVPIKSASSQSTQGNSNSNNQKITKPAQTSPNINPNKPKNPEVNKPSLKIINKQEPKKPESKPVVKTPTNLTTGTNIKAAPIIRNSSSESKQASINNVSQKNLPTKQIVNNSSSVDKKNPIAHPPIKKDKKIIPNKKYNKSTRAIFEMGDDLDSFICDDDEEESSTKGQNWKKEIDKIKKKYHRNPTYMDNENDDDIMEAQFSEIEQEESNALRIAEEEDEREELREKLFYSKKKK
jgi:hypothetical protein